MASLDRGVPFEYYHTSYQRAVKLNADGPFDSSPLSILHRPDRVSRGAGDLSMEFYLIDLDRARFEPNRTIGVAVPMSLFDEIEQRAKLELASKSGWVRRLILNELNKGPAPSKDAA